MEEDVAFISTAADSRTPPPPRSPPSGAVVSSRGWTWETERSIGADLGTGKRVHWMATAVDGHRPLVRPGALLLSIDCPAIAKSGVSVSTYRTFCPTGNERQGGLAGSGGGSFLQQHHNAWPLKRLADVDQHWSQLAERGDIN